MSVERLAPPKITTTTMAAQNESLYVQQLSRELNKRK